MWRSGAARDLLIDSNNPTIVPNDGFNARMVGDLKILTVSGARIGTSLLSASLNGSVWVRLQVQVTADGKPAAGLHDDKTYFIKPTWSSNFSGSSVTADKRLWRQEIDLGGSASIGLKGWQDITLSFNQNGMATFSTFVDKANDMLGIDVTGLKPGNVEFVAFRSGLAVASMQIFIRTTTSSKAVYVDQFLMGYYDLDFRAKGGNYSKFLVVRYSDDIVITINIDQISDAKPDPIAAKNFIATATIGDGGRRFPSQMNAGTTPNLYALKKWAVQIMEANNVQFMRVSKEAIVFLLSIMDIARGMTNSMPKIPRENAPSPVKQVLGEGAQEVRLTADEYRAALSHVFPGQSLNQVSSLVDGIGERAAQRAIADPRFVAHYNSGNMRDAGTLFHSAAAQESRSIPQSSLPAGWQLSAEKTIQAGRGGSRADIFLEGPAGELVEFDWKTTGSSAITSKTVAQMTRHSGQISTNIAGNLSTQESRSWVDFVRPLLGPPP